MVTKKKAATDNSDANEKSYRELRVELDAVLDRLQDPEGDVDDAVGLYEQAVKLASQLETRLEKAENHIKKIQADFGLVA